MASKKKNPSFEIPDAVRRAGQSGWVYRSEPVKGKRREEAPADQARAMPAVPPEPRRPRTTARPKQAETAPPAPQPDATEPTGWSASGGVLGLGLHVAAVPLVVPLYVTAAISRKLGLLPR